MQTLYRLGMPVEPSTHSHAIVLRQKNDGSFTVHWQDLDYANANGENNGSYYHGFYCSDIKAAVEEMLRRLRPKLAYHQQGRSLDNILLLTQAIATLEFALRQEDFSVICNFAPVPGCAGLELVSENPPDIPTWRGLVQEF